VRAAVGRCIALGCLVVLVAACARSPYPVEVARGIEPRLAPAEVERIAREHGADIIVEMNCVYYDTLVEMFDDAGNSVNHQSVWVVRSRGQFANPRYPGVEYDVMSWIVDDETGEILGSSAFYGRRRKSPESLD